MSENADERGLPPMHTDVKNRAPLPPLQLDELTKRIIGHAFTVSNKLGPGFLEKVYENAFAHELRKNGLVVEQQKVIEVLYDNVIVGDFVADLLVEHEVLVELKAIKALEDIHKVVCLNYLKATRLRVCLLINFGVPKIEVKRIVNDF